MKLTDELSSVISSTRKGLEAWLECSYAEGGKHLATRSLPAKELDRLQRLEREILNCPVGPGSLEAVIYYLDKIKVELDDPNDDPDYGLLKSILRDVFRLRDKGGD